MKTYMKTYVSLVIDNNEYKKVVYAGNDFVKAKEILLDYKINNNGLTLLVQMWVNGEKIGSRYY